MALNGAGLLATLGMRGSSPERPGGTNTSPARRLGDRRRTRLDQLAEAVAPTVRGHLDIKKAILLMLIGGAPKEDIDGHHRRSTIHLCLLGDPAMAKTALLQWTAAFSPRGLYTSGASSTSAGLTVAIMPDEDGCSKIIKPGALLLASGGVCCIDNFDQMKDRHQSAIREALDQQSVTVSKAGINTKLAANTSVLLAGSARKAPLGSYQSASASDGMSLSLASCFDLAFLLEDKPDSSRDERLAWHIVETACGSSRRCAPKHSSEQQLRDHLQRARSCLPDISLEAQERIRNWYVLSRQDGRTAAQVGLNRPSPRQLDGLVRLSEAVARGHLSTEVQVEHVEEALGLLRCSSCFHDAALVHSGHGIGPAVKRARIGPGRKQTASR